MKTSFSLRLTAFSAALAMSLSAMAADTPKSDKDKRPNPVKKAIGDATATVRADDDMLEVLRTLGTMQTKAIEKSTVAEARAQPTPSDAVMAVLKKQGKSTDPATLVPGVTTKEVTVTGAAGQLPATAYIPSGTGPFPVIVYFHGGGWVIADRKVYDGGARGLSKAANAVVLSVDYRRAPEAKFPAAHDDAYAAYGWAAKNAASISGDAKNLALAGESAGGNLAVATAVKVKTEGAAWPQPKAILAVYPVAQTGSLNTPSYIENAIAAPLNRAMIEWFLDKTLKTPEDKKDTRLDLVHADLKGLPPVTIVNAQLDPLRSDGDMLETALKDAGVSVERKSYSGVAHEFFGMAAVVAKAKEAQDYAGMRLKTAFGKP